MKKEHNIINYIKEIWKGSFFKEDFIMRDSRKIRENIINDLLELNFKRIAIMAEVNFIVCAAFFLFVFITKNGEYYREVCFMSALMMLHSVLFIFLSYRIHRKDKKEEGKFRRTGKRIIYYTFWLVWTLMMMTLLGIRSSDGYGGIGFMAMCVVICLVPLHSTVSFIVHLLIMGGLYAFLQVEYSAMGYAYIAMMLLGFIAQRFEIGMWVTKEYAYVNAFVDPLTKLLNRRGARAMLSGDGKAADNYGIIMLDIDFFKKYNDIEGHDAGDVCLGTVASAVKEAVSDRTELVIRHGGEEFVVIVPDTDTQELNGIAEKIRRKVYDTGLKAPYTAVAEYVTVSVGASIVKEIPQLRYEDVLERADEALYEAKKQGRNRVVIVD